LCRDKSKTGKLQLSVFGKLGQVKIGASQNRDRSVPSTDDGTTLGTGYHVPLFPISCIS
jgi:hypothetical protein